MNFQYISNKHSNQYKGTKMSSTSVRDAQRCLPKQQCLKREQREPFGGEDTQFGDGCEKKH